MQEVISVSRKWKYRDSGKEPHLKAAIAKGGKALNM